MGGFKLPELPTSVMQHLHSHSDEATTAADCSNPSDSSMHLPMRCAYSHVIRHDDTQFHLHHIRANEVTSEVRKPVFVHLRA